MSKKKNGIILELDGRICVVQIKNGKETQRDEIDGKSVLKLIIAALEDYIATKR